MNSVLVDFYNLHLRSDLGINNPPNEEERQRIIKFFETYAPNVVRKMTDQRKQQIQDFFCCDLTEKMAKEVLQNKDLENIHSLVLECNINLINKEKLVKTTQLFDAFTTLEGYEVRNRISWFESYGFENFAVEYHRIKDLIDKHLDDDKCGKNADKDWLQSRINMYLNAELDYRMIGYLEDYLALNSQDNLKAFFNKYLTKIFQFGPHLREIFPSIHKEAMSALKLKKIGKCKWNGCNNILLKSGKREYCSDECSREAKRENDRQRGNYNRDTARNHEMLCDLIELWLKLSGNDEWLKEVKYYTGTEVSMLKNQLKGEGKRISARKLKEALEYLLTDMREIPVERLKKYLTDRERNYINKYANGKIPFLGDNISADSIGGLLKEVKEKLKREKGIDMNPDKLTKSGKKKKWYTYQFMIKR